MPHGLAQIRRVAIIAALCAIAAIGLQARAALPTTAGGVAVGATGQAFADITAAVTGASLVAGIVLFVLLSRYRRRRKRNNQSAGTPMPWWARLVVVLLALAVIGGPLVLIIRAWYRRGHPAVQPVLSPALGHAGRTLGTNTSSGWALFAGMAFAAAALIIAALWVRRQRRGRDWADASRAEPGSQPSLQDALSAGTAALRDEADPRAAIIACYAAMEGSLAGAGAAPAVSDTPDEVLARAASGGLIRSAAAGELTRLFRQARYGHRDMAEGERAAAQGALTRLRADLGGAA
jgi:uncharacterized protein DUF4129